MKKILEEEMMRRRRKDRRTGREVNSSYKVDELTSKLLLGPRKNYSESYNSNI